jgi:hypothetical protein
MIGARPLGQLLGAEQAGRLDNRELRYGARGVHW